MMVSGLNFNELRYTYDYEWDILYCKINRMWQYDYTIPVTPFFNIDISKNKKVTAFELLDASEVLGLNKEELAANNLKIKITLNVTWDVIKIVINVKSEDNMGSFITKALNVDDVIPGVYNYYV